MNVSITEIKTAARGKWGDILLDAGLAPDCLNGREQPCPKRCEPNAGGDDRFNAAKDVNDTGAVYCRRCFNKSSAIKPGDGIASVAWLLHSTNNEAAEWIANRLGMTGEQRASPSDIITSTCRDKRISVEAFKLFGVKEAKRGGAGFAVCRVDLYNEKGVVHSHFDLWPGDKGRVKRGAGNSGLFFPGRIPVAGEKWLAVEGVKDASALVGIGFNAFGYCGNKLASKYARLFQGVDVIIVPDLDTAGMIGAEHSAGVLIGIASSVAIARMPGVVKEKCGDDVRDILRKPDGEKNIRVAIETAIPWTPKPTLNEIKGRPEVLVSMNEAAVTEEVVRNLGRLGWESPWVYSNKSESVRLFVRGGVLVHTIENEDVELVGRISIRDIPPCMVRERITQACSLLTAIESDDGIEVRPIRPPNWLIEAVYRRGNYDGAFRPLTGIVDSPTIRIDGSIVQTPGYDRQTGLIYRPQTSFPPVPESPTKEDAAKALSLLKQVLADFPMYHDADRSAWVAMVLSMICRSCISGYVPLFAVTANVRGAGKSLLVDAASLIAYGRRAARKTFTRDDDEMRKSITAIALGAIPSVLFDNVDIQLGGASLDAAITSATWSDRVLGQSRMTGELPMRTIWSATGNNLAFGSDIGRRVLPIRLQSPLETPESRSDFVHPDLLSWIESQRPALAVAALTIMRAFFVAGCPVQPGGEWGSFEAWSARIRGAIAWAGGEDPLPTRVTALAGDDTAALLRKLITGIELADPGGIGLTTKQIQQKTYGSQGELSDNEALAEAVFEICGEHFNARQLGKRLKGFVGRVHDGKFLDTYPARGGVCGWRIRSVPAVHAGGGFGGFGGSNLTCSDLEGNKSRQPCLPNAESEGVLF